MHEHFYYLALGPRTARFAGPEMTKEKFDAICDAAIESSGNHCLVNARQEKTVVSLKDLINRVIELLNLYGFKEIDVSESANLSLVARKEYSLESLTLALGTCLHRLTEHNRKYREK